MGLKEGKETLQKAETLWLLTGLPCIPIALIMSKFIRWERFVLQLWRQHYRSLPFFGKLFGVPVQNQRERSERLINNRDTTHPVSCTRLFTGALLLPTVSSFIGRYLFSGINNNLHRTLLVRTLMFNLYHLTNFLVAFIGRIYFYRCKRVTQSIFTSTAVYSSVKSENIGLQRKSTNWQRKK